MITIDEFYLCLKLGIWRHGQVAEWGKVEKLPAAGTVARKDYWHQPLVKKHLGTGLYLLDLYLLDMNGKTGERTYMVVIAVCRNTLEHIQSVCYLKVENKTVLREFKQVVMMRRIVSGQSPSLVNSVTKSYREHHKEQRIKSPMQV
jgi:hypothetical protein